MENLHFFTRRKKLCRKLGKSLHMSFFFIFLSNLKTLYQDKNRKFPKNANFLKCQKLFDFFCKENRLTYCIIDGKCYIRNRKKNR